ncbi:Fic family protein [Bacteroidota bacterium]
MNKKQYSKFISVFHGRQAPEKATLVGYGALIDAFNLKMPFPICLSLISKKRRSYTTPEWNIFSSRNAIEDSLYKHLVFALKYEGINLLFFKRLFQAISKKEITDLVTLEPTGQYSRKIWFLYEWLMEDLLSVPDLTIKNFVPLIDEKIQFANSKSINSSRHRIRNNLPGTPDFCPLIQRTPKLEQYIAADFAQQKNTYLNNIHKDILQRASAFLLLKDSKASFSIEGESPKSQRAARWGQAIGQAGMNDLSKEELLRLQQIVITSSRFVDMGFRQKGGFVGEHDRTTGEPIPDHISARWTDLDQLMNGYIATAKLLQESETDAVIAAAIVAFGFVFIHPFEDGNGRIHRYLIHHVLAKKQFSQQGIIFPVSASILDHIDDYRKVLESYSHPLLDYIEWKETKDNNVEVINETLDYYRFFDATKQAEFLYECVQDTIERIIPDEIKYLTNYDQFKRYLENEFDMPDKTVALLVRFLEQNNGKLSKRAREKEFDALTDMEVIDIEEEFKKIMIMIKY